MRTRDELLNDLIEMGLEMQRLRDELALKQCLIDTLSVRVNDLDTALTMAQQGLK